MIGRNEARMQSGKVVIVGTGFVGSTFAYSLMISGLASSIVLIDIDRKRAEGEAMDLNHGVSFVRPVSVLVGDYSDCEDADIIVITAGYAQEPGETRLDLVRKNTTIYEDIIGRIVQYTRNSILLIVTNPVDVMSYVAQKVSGFPPQRVIGSGTVLDTSRLRYQLSIHCGVDVKNVHAYIIGEHGDTEVPVWSLANVAGMKFDQYCTACQHSCSPQERDHIFTTVRDAAYEIIERKKATYYAVGLAMLEIVESILRNESSVLTVSSLLQDYHGVSDVYLSVPTIVDRGGVRNTIPIDLSEEELLAFHHSAKVIKDVTNSLYLTV